MYFTSETISSGVSERPFPHDGTQCLADGAWADANSGRHTGNPRFELESSQRFFARHPVRDLDAPQAHN